MKLYDVEGQSTVMVDVAAVEAEVEKAAARLSYQRVYEEEELEPVNDAEVLALTREALNNTNHWIKDEEDMTDEGRYSLFPINLATARIAEGPIDLPSNRGTTG